jgi:GTPase SAR1 family protein
MFLETSAKTGENVEESFLKCSKTILAKIETGMLYSREDNRLGLKAY